MNLNYKIGVIMNAETIHFYDEEAEGLHDRQVYEILKRFPDDDIDPTTVMALLESLDDHDLELMPRCTDSEKVSWKADRIRKSREQRRKAAQVTHRLNYPVAEVLDDYIRRRKGRRREARRQLRARFDGLDHEWQEAVMNAFMTEGPQSDRELVYKKLAGDGFWVDAYVPLVERWWEAYHDPKMADVVVKRCPRAYVIRHLDELIGYCNYASLCLKTGMRPEEGRLTYRTHLFVLKSIGAELQLLEGEEIVLKWVRDQLYEGAVESGCRSIFSVPYVKRMMRYLGAMGLTDDILALEAFDKRLRDAPDGEWTDAAIRAIEHDFSLSEYVFKEII